MYDCDARPRRPGLREVRKRQVPSYKWVEDMRDEKGRPENRATNFEGKIRFYLF